MPNDLLSTLHGTQSIPPTPKKTDFSTMYSQFRQNPMQYLSGLNIPQNLVGNPRAIVQHLANTGQVPPILQARVNAMLAGK